MRKFSSVLSLIAFTLLLCVSFKESSAEIPRDVYLLAAEPSNDPFLSKIQTGEDDFHRERAKIAYLISRIRQSPYEFIRNGKSHQGPKAANHLTAKYRRRFDSIQNASDFIEKIATSSAMTGEAYGVRFPDGQVYPARDVFFNELNRLEKCLQTSGVQIQS